MCLKGATISHTPGHIFFGGAPAHLRAAGQGTEKRHTGSQVLCFFFGKKLGQCFFGLFFLAQAAPAPTPYPHPQPRRVLFFVFAPLGVTEKRLRGAGGAAGLFVPCRSQHLGAAGSKPAAPAGPGALASGLPCLGACELARLFWGHFRTRNTLINQHCNGCGHCKARDSSR
jgi:hypothetical protein